MRALTSVVGVSFSILLTACGPFIDAYDRNFDYAGASEEEQQRYLEGAAKRFALGARVVGGDAFEVTQVFADASVDLMSVSVRSKHAYMDRVSAEEIADANRDVTEELCIDMDKKIGLDKGYTVRMRFFKYSGAPLTTIEVNKEACARYV